ncbi:MAG: alginate lyase family protein [candidate division KSB1 bacterium]|nr:alginate lyase family protein [candidate division KSB1 bacterium]
MKTNIKWRRWLFLAGWMLTQAARGQASIGIWTSAAELSHLPTHGPAWEAVLQGASQDCSHPDVSNQDDNTNVYVLAAAIVYARTGNQLFKDRVIAACEKLVQQGQPKGRTLAWARETGAYAMAADLVGYKTTAFEKWLRNMAEVYVAEDGRTMRQMYEQRPNNWGSHAFGSLCAIYRYLGDITALSQIRAYWIKGVLGPNPGFIYGDDLSWHADAKELRLINPKGAMKAGMNIDGIIPDDMRRGGSFHNPPGYTGYAWGFMQGQIMAARILERAGLPIWAVGDSALYRAAHCLQIRFENKYGGWAAKGDDEWMLPFLDEAYGTRWSNNQKRLWQYGKNAGWGYVILGKLTQAP